MISLKFNIIKFLIRFGRDLSVIQVLSLIRLHSNWIAETPLSDKTFDLFSNVQTSLALVDNIFHISLSHRYVKRYYVLAVNEA